MNREDLTTWEITGKKIKSDGDVEIYIKGKYGLRLFVSGDHIGKCDLILRTKEFDAFAKTIYTGAGYVVDVVINDKPAAAIYHVIKAISDADYIFGRGPYISESIVNKMMDKYNYRHHNN